MPKGWTELRHLGWFYRKNFPSLFRRYTDETYLFLYTDTNRTISSYQAFVEGVFGPEAYKTIDAKIDEALLNVSRDLKNEFFVLYSLKLFNVTALAKK